MAKRTKLRSRGRPTKYSNKLADAIFERLADGEPISRICRRPGMPCRRTVMRWQDERPDFCHLITMARKFACDALLDQVREDVDRCPNDNDAIRACRLKMKTVSWFISKIQPRNWGGAVTRHSRSGDSRRLRMA